MVRGTEKSTGETSELANSYLSRLGQVTRNSHKLGIYYCGSPQRRLNSPLNIQFLNVTDSGKQTFMLTCEVNKGNSGFKTNMGCQQSWISAGRVNTLYMPCKMLQEPCYCTVASPEIGNQLSMPREN